MFLSRLRFAHFALPAVLLAAPLTAADLPKDVTVTTDSHGRPMVRMDCHDRASDERLALLGANPKVEVVRLAGASDFTDAGLAHVAKLPNLRELSVIGTEITERGLKHLAGHAALQDLSLRGKPITRAAAETLATIPHLTSLTLRNQTVELDALKVLAGVKSLKVLRINNSELTDADLTAARGFAKLETLELGGKRFTPAALGLLAEPKALRELSLSDLSLTGVSAKPVGGLVGLERLTLSDTSATPEAYDVIRELPKLRELSVYGQQTDADLDPLGRFTRLTVIHLHGTKISQAKTSALRAALPRTAVSPWGWKHTVADLKAMSKVVEAAPDGTVVAVGMLCNKPASDAKLGVLHQFPGVKRLTAFGGPTLTDAGLAQLKDLRHLEELEVGSDALTDAGLKHLAECKGLRSITIQADRVTDAGLAELRKALPRAKVERD